MDKNVLETLSVDMRKKQCLLNGEDISKDTSELHLDFEYGKWSLSVTRTTKYTTNDHETKE